MLSNAELLAKVATGLQLADFGGTNAPLTVEQVQQFLRLAMTPQVMLPEVRTVMSNSNKWEESKLDFGTRIMKPGNEGERLDTGDRVKPTTGFVTISTVLIRAEVPVTDEVMEDQVERAGFADTLITMIAEGCGRDIEELMIKGDTDDSFVHHDELPGSYLRLCDGWLKRAGTIASGGHVFDAVGLGQDYQEFFKQLLVVIPARFKGDTANLRYWVPVPLVEKYRDMLAARGTPLGDLTLQGTSELRYQGILIKGVPNFPVLAGSPDTSFILLGHRLNFYAGYRRMIKMETFRDPREGMTSFCVTARVDAQLAVPEATAIAKNVSVEP